MVTVSAVIPTRGRPELLRRAVHSALAQTLRDIEVVVVIDGPDPATHGVLEELARQDQRLHVLALTLSLVKGRSGWSITGMAWADGVRSR